MLGVFSFRAVRPHDSAATDLSGAVAQLRHTFCFGAVITAEERAVLLKPVTDDLDAAIRAGGGKRVNCALEAVECVNPSVFRDLEGLVVVVTARFAFRHGKCPVREADPEPHRQSTAGGAHVSMFSASSGQSSRSAG